MRACLMKIGSLRLVPSKHHPHLRKWDPELSLFTEEHRSYYFEQTLALFLTRM